MNADIMDDDFECHGSDDGENDDEWNEMEPDDSSELSGSVKCLFCETICSSVKDVFQHINIHHHFNILKFMTSQKFDCFTYIKFVNYMRNNVCSPNDITGLMDGQSKSWPWEDDKYMIPHDSDDLLLQFDLESDEADGDVCYSSNEEVSVDKLDMRTENETVYDAKYAELTGRVEAAEARAVHAQDEVVRVLEDMNKMKITANEFMLSHDSAHPHSDNVIADLDDDENESYFNSYSHFGIHREMLSDTIRTESYRDFFYKNPELLRNKVVLDVGCGTGILSMFAAKAGAKHVIGVDQSDVIYQAMDIIRENNFSDKITLVKGRLEDVNLPVDKVDIIVSEWMGYFLLFESMLDTIIYARDKYLAEGGAVYPDICTIHLFALADDKLFARNIDYWDDVYGFKMSCMKSEVVKEAGVDYINNDCVISDNCIIKELNVCKCAVTDLEFSSDFTLIINRDGRVTSLGGHFDIKFIEGCNNKVEFSTSPASKRTHWKQTYFLLQEPLHVKKGDEISGKIIVKKSRKNPRALVITLYLRDKKHVYLME